MATRPKNVNIKGASAGLIVQYIIDNDRSGYLAGTPLATNTDANLQMAGTYILAEQNRRNAFANAIVNKIFMTIIRTVGFYSDWERYTEKGVLENGETIEEIYVGLVAPEQYVWTENINDTMKALFSKRPQEVASAYHSINFEKRYPVTVTYTELRKAFRSMSQMEEFIRIKVEGAYKSYIYHNYLMNKYMLYRLALDGQIKNYNIQPITDRRTGDNALIQIKAAILDSSHIRSTNTLSKLPQAMEKRKAIVIRSIMFGASIDVQALAQAFNLQYAEYAERQLTIDGISEEENEIISRLLSEDPDYVAFTPAEMELIPEIAAFVVDEDFFMNYMYLYEMDDVYNGAERYWNYFLHVWKVYGVSPFKTVYMFSYENGAVESVTISPMAADMATGSNLQFSVNVLTTGFADKSVTWSIEGANDTEGKGSTNIGLYGDLHIGANETAEEITVTATSVYDNTKSATATVTVKAVTEVQALSEDITPGADVNGASVKAKAAKASLKK